MAWVIGIGIGLLLLFAFPRQVGALLLLIVLAVGGFLGYLYLEEQKRADEEQKKRTLITIAVSYDLARCGGEFPMLIDIRNGYTETIQNLTFDIAGYREGYSSPVYRSSYKSDRIITPGETYSACWNLPRVDYGAVEVPPAGLVWSARYSYATFGR